VPQLSSLFKSRGLETLKSDLLVLGYGESKNGIGGQITVVTISRMLRWSSASSVIGLLIATSQARCG
jgi:hypothetical protein